MSCKIRLFRKTKRFLLQKICLSTLKSDAFPQTKRFSFTQAILFCPQTPNVFTNQKLSIWTNLSLLPSMQPFSALHLPLAPSHNLLSTKERRCSCYLRSYSLRCNTGASHRFKAFSPPSCAKNWFRLVPSESSAKSFFDRALNRGRRTESRVLFGYFLHNAKSDKPFPSQGASRFCKPRISAHKRQIRTNKIKFFWNFRGFPNLDSARRNGGFAETKLKPSQKELRGFANLEPAH